MSTILKALRKIESETEAGDLSSLTWPGPVKVRQRVDERMRIRKIRRRAVFGFGILILVFCGTWYFSHRSASAPPAVVAIREHTAPPPVMSSTAGSAGKNEFRADESGSVVAKAGITAAVPPASTGSDGMPPVPAVLTETVPKHSDIPESVPEQMDNLPSADLALETRHDPRVELQAIAWSPEPAESFAVINNQILHEGQSFDGITIVRIGRDDVSFREMGREWREDFRLK